jgi:hypothetical protein
MVRADEATRFKPGQSGNPNCASPRKSLSLRNRENAILFDCETAPCNLCRCKGEVFLMRLLTRIAPNTRSALPGTPRSFASVQGAMGIK